MPRNKKRATKPKILNKCTYTLKLKNGGSKVVTRKRRKPIDKELVDELEKIFNDDHKFPQGKGTMKVRQQTMKDLSMTTSLTFEQLRRWFDNRTQKAKRIAAKSGEPVVKKTAAAAKTPAKTKSSGKSTGGGTRSTRRSTRKTATL